MFLRCVSLKLRACVLLVTVVPTRLEPGAAAALHCTSLVSETQNIIVELVHNLMSVSCKSACVLCAHA